MNKKLLKIIHYKIVWNYKNYIIEISCSKTTNYNTQKIIKNTILYNYIYIISVIFNAILQKLHKVFIQCNKVYKYKHEF